MQELKRVVKLHANWLVYATLGESALSTSEVTELKRYGKLPMGQPLDLVDKSYLLGRFRSLLKKQEYNNINYEEITAAPLSPLEELVVEQARLRAGQALKGVAQEIADGTYSSLAQVLGKAVSEAVVSQAVADETALAIIHRKTAQELASNLAQRLQTAHKRNWKIVAETALQTAKVAGSAQAIVNKVGVYALSDGADSMVSVIPGPACCADCATHYTGPDGQPRVFRLATLLGAGSNADSDVTHQKQSGRHVYWKTTLPPLHPSCGCSIVYIPPGHGWVDGKLSMLNKSLFMEHLVKARSGVSGGISPTVEPQGAPSNKSEETKTPSMPGAAAPGNQPGPGRTPGGLPKPGSGTPGGSGGGKQLMACPWAKCPIGHHETGSKTFEEHAAIAAHNREFTPAAEESNTKALNDKAVEYNSKPHPHAEVSKHLSEGVLSSSEDISSAMGINKKWKVTFTSPDGTVTSGIMKPAPVYSEDVWNGQSIAEGAAVQPKDSGHVSEVGSSMLAQGLGLTSHIPPTVQRASSGDFGMPKAPMSVQQWKDDYHPVALTLSEDANGHPHRYKAMLDRSKDPEKLHNKMSELAVFDIVQNHGDRHLDNFVANDDFTDVQGIDNGAAFGSGMQGQKNLLIHEMHKANKPLTVPDHLMSRFNNASLEDTTRALGGSGLQPWQVAQTHLRQKYVAHLQETHGYIPHEATRCVTYSVANKGENSTPYGRVGFAPGNGLLDQMLGAKQAEKDGQLPDQVFASWAKSYIDKHKNDPNSPNHADAVKLDEMMPLHKAGRAHDPEYDGSREHQRDYMAIPPYQGLKCETFEARFGKKQAEKPAPLRTAPVLPTMKVDPAVSEKQHLAYQATQPQMPRSRARSDEATMKPTKPPASYSDEATRKPTKKSLWLDLSKSFPFDNIDEEG